MSQGLLREEPRSPTAAENHSEVQKKSLGGLSEGPGEKPVVKTGLRSRHCGPHSGSENQGKIP